MVADPIHVTHAELDPVDVPDLSLAFIEVCPCERTYGYTTNPGVAHPAWKAAHREHQPPAPGDTP